MTSGSEGASQQDRIWDLLDLERNSRDPVVIFREVARGLPIQSAARLRDCVGEQVFRESLPEESLSAINEPRGSDTSGRCARLDPKASYALYRMRGSGRQACGALETATRESRAFLLPTM